MNRFLRGVLYNLPYYFMILMGIILFIQAIPTLKMDAWGFDSMYMHKVLFILLGTQVFYNAGFLRTPKIIIKRFANSEEQE